MNILCIGDIYGRPGRDALTKLLPELIDEHSVDFVIVNVENSAGGRGITEKIAQEFSKLPIDIMTGGNHIWQHEPMLPKLTEYNILRPLNAHHKKYGNGFGIVVAKNKKRVAVVNLQGEIFMDHYNHELTSPFESIEKIIAKLHAESDIIIVDFHAEATSEKRALGVFLDGRVQLVYGTHTHVQTADDHIMPGGTAYISDIGMTGPHDSVIGLDKEVAIVRFISKEKVHRKVGETGIRIEGVLLTVDDATHKSTNIQRIKRDLK